MNERYLMGVDIGTTGAKAAIFNTAGEIVAQAYRESACTYPKPGWVEQDADWRVAASFETAAEALRKSGLAPAQVAAVSFSTQRCCTIFVDRDGKLTRPMISATVRTVSKEVVAFRPIGSRRASGLRPGCGTNSVTLERSPLAKTRVWPIRKAAVVGVLMDEKILC